MKKYIPVFGDQSLFDGMMPDCEFIVGTYGYKIKDGKCFYCEKYNHKYGWSPTGDAAKALSPVIAMRRIIPEPKRWTQADKDAGRLPEVGVKCRQGHKDEIVVAVTEKFVVTECQDMSVCTTRKDVFMRSYNPIETPEEKAQREEDEFVESTCRQNEPHSTLYSDGVRAAYRKLKGGE